MFAGGIEASIIRLARGIPTNPSTETKANPRMGDSNRRMAATIPIAFIIVLLNEEPKGSRIPSATGIK